MPLERPYTLGHPYSHPLERAHGRIASGEDPMGFTFPVYSGRDCMEGKIPRLEYTDSSAGARAGLLAIAGQEFRSEGGGPWSTELGGIASGARGPLSFQVDARMYTETAGRADRPSFDREDVDQQTGEASGALDYRSYSRFRGDLTLDLPFGRLTAARDAAHWGPGLYGNAVLSQQAIPYFQASYSSDIGPLRITSLYGDLAIGGSQGFSPANVTTRSLYAHRYELRLGGGWLAGIAEQIILYDMSKPYLFIPIFPLFIAKGFLVEERTNGSIAADLSWRSPWSTLFYGEFLLDDLESPSSLFLEDYIQNKWAVLAGLHWSGRFGSVEPGVIAELSHVEPWVYGHFEPSTAQAAHAGLPLGNPYGADSRTAILKLYARFSRGLYAGLTSGLYWKGKGASASLEQPVPTTPLATKTRLEDEGGPDVALEPEAAASWRFIHAYMAGRIGADPAFRAGIRLSY